MSRLLWVAAGGLAGAILGLMGFLALGDPAGVARAGRGPAFPSGKENSSVFLFNAGAADAQVVVSYYSAAGAYLAGDSCPGGSTAETNRCSAAIAPGQSFRFDQYYDTGLGNDYRGSGTLAADQPMDTLVIKNIEDDGDVPTLSYSIENAPSNTYLRLFLPLIQQEAGGWGSRFSVQNGSDSEAACILVTFYDASGNATASPPAGQLPNEGRCPNGGWAILPLGTYTATPGEPSMPLPDGFSGAALIESLPNVDGRRAPIVGEADLYRGGERPFDSYPALGLATLPDGTPLSGFATDDLSRKVYLPLIQRGSLEGGGTPWTTRIRIASSNPATPIVAWIQYVGTGPSRGTRAACRITVRGFADDAGCRLPKGFTGYAILRSATPLAAVVEREQQPAAGLARYAIYAGSAAGPLPAQIDIPLAVSDYWTGWTSKVRILSLDGLAPVLDLELIPRPGDSCITETLTKRVRAPEAAFSLNFAAGGYYSPWPGGVRPGCFYGALRITADRPITALAMLTLLGMRGDIEAMYRGLARPS